MKTKLNNIIHFILVDLTGIYLTPIDASYHIGVSKKFLQKLTEAGVFTTIGSENKLYNKRQLNAWVKKNRIVNAYF